MILQSQSLPVERGGVTHESQFTIKATAKAFSILSSSLYADKILAIVRELSCNAYDAHVAAGHPEMPIEVKLPTHLDPTFYIKDNGTGLSHEQIAGYYKEVPNEKTGEIDRIFIPGIYQTFFDSNKTDSDEYIGALGLGSKTPFSYTNAFVVESRHNGMHRTYSAFINDEGVPAISLLGEEPTTEPNGMKISLATNRDDSDRFVHAAQRAFMYFTPKPKVLGYKHFEAFKVTHPVVGTGWKVRDASWQASMEGAYVVQGLVAYHVDAGVLGRHGLSGIAETILEQNIDLFVPIGAVEPQPSREGLSYTPSMIKNLTNIVETAANEMHTSYQKMFDALPSYWDAQQLHQQLSHYTHKGNKLYNQLVRQKPFVYNGKTIKTQIVVDCAGIKNTEVTVASIDTTQYANRLNKKGRWDPETTLSEFDFEVSANMYVIVNDEGVGRDRLSGWLGSIVAECEKKQVRENIRVIMIKGTSKKNYDQKEVDNLIAQIGVPNPVYASKLNIASSTSSSTYKAKKIEQAFAWKGFPEERGYGGCRGGSKRMVFSRLCWDNEMVDFNAGGLYVPVERFTVIDFEKNAERLDSLVGDFNLFNGAKIYGLNEKQQKLVANDPKWINAFLQANTIAPTLNANNVIANTVKANTVFNGINMYLRDKVLRRWNSVCDMFDDGSKFKEVMSELYLLNKSPKTTDFDIGGINSRAHHLSPIKAICDQADKEGNIQLRKYEVMIKGYELLKLIDWGKVNGDSDIHMIAQYVNAIG